MKKTFLFKIREGKLDQWKQWCALLATRVEEARATLQDEHASREYCVLFQVDDTHYVYGTTEYSADPQDADMTKSLNTEHRAQVQECLERVARGQELYDISVIN